MTKREIQNLFKTHYTQMYRLAVTILYDEDESKDVVSEETGAISIAINGSFHLRLSAEELEGYLTQELS